MLLLTLWVLFNAVFTLHFSFFGWLVATVVASMGVFRLLAELIGAWTLYLILWRRYAKQWTSHCWHIGTYFAGSFTVKCWCHGVSCTALIVISLPNDCSEVSVFLITCAFLIFIIQGIFLEKIKSENPGIPCFLFGHSTGGAVVLKVGPWNFASITEDRAEMLHVSDLLS